MNSSVFVVGSARSGTTLLYHILLASGEFAVYDAETWLLEKGQSRYGKLRSTANRKEFVEDWIESGQFERSGLSARDYLDEIEGSNMSVAELLAHFMGLIAKNQGKPRWAEKTPSHVYHMKEIKARVPTAKFIHIIRDGRSVAASLRKIGWSARSEDSLAQLAWAAQTWVHAFAQGRKAASRMAGDCLEVKYEDIVTDLGGTLNRINDFLGTAVTEQDVQNSAFGALGKSNTAFGDQKTGLHQDALTRWKTELTPEENGMLAALIGPTLKELGYELPQDDYSLPLSLRLRIVWWRIGCPLVIGLRRFLKNQTPLGRYLTRGYEEFPRSTPQRRPSVSSR